MNTNNWVEPQIGECIARSVDKYVYKKKAQTILYKIAIGVTFAFAVIFVTVAFLQGFEEPSVYSIGIFSSLLCAWLYFDFKSYFFTWDLYYIDRGVFIMKEDVYKGQELISNQVGLKDGKLIYKGISFILSDRFKHDPLSLLNFINSQL
jgi:hypothetical protein